MYTENNTAYQDIITRIPQTEEEAFVILDHVFHWEKSADGLYHVRDHYTTQKEQGRNLLMEILREGYFHSRIFDMRLSKLFDHKRKYKKIQWSANTQS